MVAIAVKAYFSVYDVDEPIICVYSVYSSLVRRFNA
jgi:hypothetical protein